MVANILPAAPNPPLLPLALGLGSKGQNSTVSEHAHVSYQIKGNHECSNMVANILPADPSLPDPGDGVKRSKFNLQNMVMLHIKLKGITNAATW